jgi:hypothetical protein
MRFILLAVLAASCIATAATPPTPQTAQIFGNLIFEQLCEIMKEDDERIDCTYIQPPVTVVTALVKYVNYGSVNGVFVWDEPYVFISTLARDIQGTMRHEIGHYIRWYSGIRENVCVEERTVRKYAGQPWGPDEREIYGCDENDEPKPRRQGRM